jgi:septal ring factor EnvC (AmiA/AmiB activator)
MAPYRKLHQQFGADCGNVLSFLQKISTMVTTRSENHRMQRNTQDRSAQDNTRTSNDPQIAMDLLRKKIAQMEKELANLANKNAALQACIPRPSHSETVPPEDEEARNSHIGSQSRKEKVPNQNQYVPFCLFS